MKDDTSRTTSAGHGGVPVPAPGLQVTEVAEGLVIFDPQTSLVHTLNNTAAVVFSLCDGRRDAHDIARELGELFRLPEAPHHEVDECLRDLTERSMLLSSSTGRFSGIG